MSKSYSTRLYHESHNPVIISGKLDESERSRILQNLRDAKAYDVRGSRGDEAAGGRKTTYTVGVDAAKVIAGNATLPGRQDDKTLSSIVAGLQKDTEVTFTVNDSTGLIESIEFKLKKNTVQGNDYTNGRIIISYPGESSVREISNENK